MKRYLLIHLLALLSAMPHAYAQPQDNDMPRRTLGLKDAYKDEFMVGVAVNQRNITDSAQRALICQEFNSLTAENDMKPQPTEPAEGQFNWERADRIADFCRENGIRLRGHCLVWHNQIGDWIYKDKKGRPVSKKMLLRRLRKHIQAIVNRYKDVIYCWDVVNEAITDNPHAENPYRPSRLYEIAGDDFIREAFHAARKADPQALLFYNDYNECDPVKSERIANMVRSMKADGVPIDGIGMQGHYNIYGPSEEEVEAALEKYGNIVEHIHVTELDVRANREMGGQLQFSQTGDAMSEQVILRQQRQYAALFRAFRNHADRIDCVTFWNLSDRDSWLGAENYPLLFGKDYARKPVYDIVFDKRSPESVPQPTACKVINVIGDSYVRNHRRPFTETWHYKVAERLGMKYNNYGRNGGCIAFDRSREGFGKSLLQRYQEMTDTADYVLVIAGHNDATKIGNNRDSLSMFRDSLEALCQGLQEKYPQAKIAFVTPWDVPKDGFAEVIQTLTDVCGQYHIPVLNAATTSGIKVRDEQFRKRYFQAPHDTAHLNGEGHDLLLNWGEEFIRGL